MTTLTVNGLDVSTVTWSRYVGSDFNAYSVNSNDSYFYALQSDLDSVSATIGSPVAVYGLTFEITSIEYNAQSALSAVRLRET